MRKTSSVSHTFYRDEQPEMYKRKKREDSGVPRTNDLQDIPEGTDASIHPGRYQHPSDGKKDDKHPAVALNDIKAPYNPTSGSARVIPPNQGFVNNTDWKSKKTASLYRNITKKLYRKIRDRAKKYKSRVLVKRVSPQKTLLTFSIKNYVVKIKKKESGKDFKDVDLKISCSCPFWVYQGPEHWAQKQGYLLGRPQGSAEEPTVRDPDGGHKLCKHSYAALLYMKRKGL